MFERYSEFLKLLFLIVIWYCLVVSNHEYCTHSSSKTVPTPKVLFAYQSQAFAATFWSEKRDSFRLWGKKYCNWCWCWVWDSTLHSPSTLQEWFNVCRHRSDLLSFFLCVRHQSSSWGAVVNKLVVNFYAHGNLKLSISQISAISFHLLKTTAS